MYGYITKFIQFDKTPPLKWFVFFLEYNYLTFCVSIRILSSGNSQRFHNYERPKNYVPTEDMIAVVKTLIRFLLPGAVSTSQHINQPSISTVFKSIPMTGGFQGPVTRKAHPSDIRKWSWTNKKKTKCGCRLSFWEVCYVVRNRLTSEAQVIIKTNKAGLVHWWTSSRIPAKQLHFKTSVDEHLGEQFWATLY